MLAHLSVPVLVCSCGPFSLLSLGCWLITLSGVLETCINTHF